MKLNFDTWLIIILLILIVVLVIVIIIASRYHVKKAPFKPTFIQLSDGGVRMEFSGFGGVQTTRTARFQQEYSVGQKIAYNGGTYRIADIKEVVEAGTTRLDLKMVCYLEKLSGGYDG